ncbi:MAG: guanylate kinase [Planctomycetes bacterium]|nr:guanylate kinase [Planctomycetota bacterium]
MSPAAGRLVVISGPSGAGKTSVCRALKQLPEVEFSISATTRPRREGEQDGVDYWFLERAEFERRVQAGEFFEWASYNGNLYGTPRWPMDAALARGRSYLLEIEVAGTRQLRECGAAGLYLFIAPPSIDELRRRLIARGSNAMAEIEERVRIAEDEVRAAREEFGGRPLYDEIVTNIDLEATIARCKELIRS